MPRPPATPVDCPIARSLERVGERWSLLILRDALAGLRRFDEFEASLGIAPNMLSRRLQDLVKTGMLEKRRYSSRPPRFEYRPTARGRDLTPVLLALIDYGNRHFAPEGRSVTIVDAVTGEPADLALVDRRTGREIVAPDYAVVAGPAASETTKARLAKRAQRLAERTAGAPG